MDLNAILNKAIQNLQEDDDMMSAGIDASLEEAKKNPNYYADTVVDPKVPAATKAAVDAVAAAPGQAAQAAQAVADAGAGGAKILAGESPVQLTPAQKAMIKIDQAQEWAKANPALAAGVPAALLAGAGALALRRRQLAARGK